MIVMPYEKFVPVIRDKVRANREEVDGILMIWMHGTTEEIKKQHTGEQQIEITFKDEAIETHFRLKYL